VFPQVERTVFRIDVGFPLGPADPAAETTVVDRAVTVTLVGAPAVVGAVQTDLILIGP